MTVIGEEIGAATMKTTVDAAMIAIQTTIGARAVIGIEIMSETEARDVVEAEIAIRTETPRNSSLQCGRRADEADGSGVARRLRSYVPPQAPPAPAPPEG